MYQGPVYWLLYFYSGSDDQQRCTTLCTAAKLTFLSGLSSILPNYIQLLIWRAWLSDLKCWPPIQGLEFKSRVRIQP